MNEREQAALAALSPEDQDKILAQHQERRDQMEAERQAALESAVAANPCCTDHNRDGRIRAARYGFEWQTELCQQHREGARIPWLIHGSGRGLQAGDFDAAAA